MLSFMYLCSYSKGVPRLGKIVFYQNVCHLHSKDGPGLGERIVSQQVDHFYLLLALPPLHRRSRLSEAGSAATRLLLAVGLDPAVADLACPPPASIRTDRHTVTQARTQMRMQERAHDPVFP